MAVSGFDPVMGEIVSLPHRATRSVYVNPVTGERHTTIPRAKRRTHRGRRKKKKSSSFRAAADRGIGRAHRPRHPHPRHPRFHRVKTSHVVMPELPAAGAGGPAAGAGAGGNDIMAEILIPLHAPSRRCKCPCASTSETLAMYLRNLGTPATLTAKRPPPRERRRQCVLCSPRDGDHYNPNVVSSLHKGFTVTIPCLSNMFGRRCTKDLTLRGIELSIETSRDLVEESRGRTLRNDRGDLYKAMLLVQRQAMDADQRFGRCVHCDWGFYRGGDCCGNFHCGHCAHTICYGCGFTHDASITCDAAKETRDLTDMDDGTRAFIESTTQKCPCCGVRNSKDDSCSKVVCGRHTHGRAGGCGTKFCYDCAEVLTADYVSHLAVCYREGVYQGLKCRAFSVHCPCTWSESGSQCHARQWYDGSSSVIHCVHAPSHHRRGSGTGCDNWFNVDPTTRATVPISSAEALEIRTEEAARQAAIDAEDGDSPDGGAAGPAAEDDGAAGPAVEGDGGEVGPVEGAAGPVPLDLGLRPADVAALEVVFGPAAGDDGGEAGPAVGGGIDLDAEIAVGLAAHFGQAAQNEFPLGWMPVGWMEDIVAAQAAVQAAIEALPFG